MDIKKTVSQYYAEWIAHKGPSWAKCMTKALEDQAANHAIEMRAYEATVQNQAERIRQLESELCSKHNAIELLRIFQRNLGSDREMCDEHEGELWDRIDATCKALAAAPQPKKEPRHE